jgi:hypothetical protein
MKENGTNIRISIKMASNTERLATVEQKIDDLKETVTKGFDDLGKQMDCKADKWVESKVQRLDQKLWMAMMSSLAGTLSIVGFLLGKISGWW